jgi:tetratricopeptide (TPR) repeat protein
MSAQELFTQAQENYNMGILSLTEENLTALIAEYPHYAPAHHLLAKVAYDDNQTIESIMSHYDNAIKYDPNNQTYQHEKAYRNANFLFLNDGMPEAKNIVLQILKENTNHAGANFLMGQLIENELFQKEISGEIQDTFSEEFKKIKVESKLQSLKYYDKALETEKNNQEWFLMRGQLYHSLDFITKEFPRIKTEYLEKCVLDFTSTIDLDTTTEWGASAYIGRSNAYIELEKFDEAIFDLDMARTFVPHHTLSNLQAMASIKESYKQDYQSALETYNELIDYLENNEEFSTEFAQNQKSSPYYNRGMLKINHLNQKTEGIADLKKASDYMPEDTFYKEEYENSLH